MIYALDTCAIISILNKKACIIKRFNDMIKSGVSLVIPSAVDYEIMRGFYYAPKPNKHSAYTSMRNNCPIVEVNASIWDCAAALWAILRSKGLTIGDFDILIAAFCIVNSYTLVTHNTKHFADIDGLNIVDWA